MKPPTVAGAALLASALTLLLVLAWVVGGRWWLNRQALLGPRTWSSTPAVLVGVPAPAFLIESLAGDTVPAPPSGSMSLLIAYSTTGRFCEASVRNWERLVAQICDRAQVFLVSYEAIEVQRAYWGSKPGLNGLECTGLHPVIGKAVDARDFGELYGVRGTPMHFVIDAGGEVVRTWTGAVGRRSAIDSLVSILHFGG